MLFQHEASAAIQRVFGGVRIALLVLAVWLALTNGLVWAGAHWGTWRGTHFDVPIAPGRAIHMHIGDRFLWRYTDMGAVPAEEREVFRPIRIAVRYRTGPGWSGRQLFTLYLPVWPLLPLTLGVGAATLLAFVPARPLGRR